VYKSYFGISSNPFSIAPNPHFLYMSDGHREALAHLQYGLGEGGGFVLLTGEVGTGKTTMCRCLLEQVPEGTNVALVINPKLSSRELVATICDELGIAYPEHSGLKSLIDRLNAYLLAAHSRGQRTVLIIDEAQNLSHDVLEQVRLLTNLETDQQRLLQIVLLGQPELQEMLAQPELRQLSQRIAARHHLVPLTKGETVAYIRHRLSVAGMDPETFSMAAMRKIFRESGGTPRTINLICDRSLLGAYAKGVRRVDVQLAREAARQIMGGKIEPRLTLIPTWMILAAMSVAVFLIVAAGWRWFGDEPFGQPGTSGKAAPVAPGVFASLSRRIGLGLGAAEGKTAWPTAEQAANSQAAAYPTLLALWGEKVEAGVQVTCRSVQTLGLRCLTPQGGLDDLLRLNKPAIISMRREGVGFSMVLVRVSGRQAILRLGSAEITTSLAEMATLWDGGGVIFWRPPPGFSGNIIPGAKGPVVGWLAEQLALIDGGKYNASTDQQYDAPLVERVKRIQVDRNLKPDGIVGGEVLIGVADLAGISAPVLRQSNR